VSHGAVAASLPVHLAGLRRAAQARPRGGASEAADDLVLALNEAATNAILHGSTGGQPVQLVVHVNDDMIQASVLDHGPDLPGPAPTDADTDARWPLAGGDCGCWTGWWMRCGLSASGSGPA
jgi:anti-sigma regulatory factor (Ser/Thr protein kinase)